MPPVETTPQVRILPDELVNQIAAGEVVERPASVVKELVENALDARARSIEIVLENGGKRLVEVSDDGSGMSARDAIAALERHATSKIRSFDDLLNVATLGFRGEALPSIASVSRFSILTWDGIEAHGIEIDCVPGIAPESRPAARARGTTIRVADLFDSVPARRKFLKSTDAEFRSIVSIVSSYALPNPGVAFRLSHNAREVLDLPSASDARERVVQILGSDVDESLAEIAMTIDPVSTNGFVTRGLRYGSRRNQYFFVNGRLVKDRVLAHAVNRATEAFDGDGHPGVVLFVAIDPQLVDVNVHPAKTEVRFRDSGQVHVAVEVGVRNALGGPAQGGGLLSARETSEPSDGEATRVDGSWPAISERADAPAFQSPLIDPVSQPRSAPRYEATPLFQQKAIVQPPREAPLGDLRGRVIGQYRDSYVLVDMPEGLRLVDQHAAHERVLYERLLAAPPSHEASQRLLEPYIYEPGAAEAGTIASYLGELREAGFEIEPFSRGSFAISSIPAILRREGVDAFFRKLLDAAAWERSHVERLRDRLLATIACHAAIKVHRPMSGSEMSQLIADLLGAANPFACPHGRPIIVDIRHFDIEKHFHRR
ncbi:MAG: DNA mismatch repair endonuclease MutL [Acidobacteria bacterium]|nr:DNA mismatch repair endonuclease MutL [Acidobacteriota bacterium]